MDIIFHMTILSSDKKRQIAEWPDSIRATARIFAVSPTTVWKLRNQNATGSIQSPEKFAALPDNLRQLLSEYVRLSRFPQRQWIEFVGGVLTGLPTSHAKKLWEDRPDKNAGSKVASQMWPYKLLNKEIHQELGGGRLSLPAKQGEWAIHRVRVVWQRTTPKGKAKENSAEILCMMERSTGMLYLRGFDRIRPEAIVDSLFRFYTICPIDIEKLVFVGKRFKGRVVSTAGLKDENRWRNHLSRREEFWGSNYELQIEAPLGQMVGKKIQLPWSFHDTDDLDRALRALTNRYNGELRKGTSEDKSGRIFTPRERLWALYNNIDGVVRLSRRKFDQRTTFGDYAKLSRRWHKE